MHTAKIYTKNYANGKNVQVNITWRSRPPTANSIYQQHRALTLRPHTACSPPAPCSHTACSPPVLRPHAVRTLPARTTRI